MSRERERGAGGGLKIIVDKVEVGNVNDEACTVVLCVPKGNSRSVDGTTGKLARRSSLRMIDTRLFVELSCRLQKLEPTTGQGFVFTKPAPARLWLSSGIVVAGSCCWKNDNIQ